MNVVKAVLAKLGKVFLVVLATFRRALCCIRRRRRNSDTPLPFVVDVRTLTSAQQQSCDNEDAPDLRNWNSWGDEEHPSCITVVDNHRPVGGGDGNRAGLNYMMYRRQQSGSDTEPDVDYFQDMTPRITKPAKIVIKKHNNSLTPRDGVSNRLAVDPQLASGVGELGHWEETEGSWEDSMDSELGCDTNSVLKESKLLEREKRAAEHLKRKQERELVRTGKKFDHLATKIS